MWTKSSDDLDENIETRLVIAIDDDDDDKLRFSSYRENEKLEILGSWFA